MQKQSEGANPWRVRSTNYIQGFEGASYFRCREDAERFVEIRKRSVTGGIGEVWTVEYQVGGAWLCADSESIQ
jgi:hypothetical protein